MTLLFDTNVLLDFLLDREPFADQAAELLTRVEQGKINGFTCATSLTTIFYLARKHIGLSAARKQTRALLSLLEVAPVNRSALENAIDSKVRDFEDAVIVESAALVSADFVVTRDAKDFAKSKVPAQSPTSMLAILGARHADDSKDT